MNRRHLAYLMGVILILFVLGCGAREYGKTRVVEKGEMTVETLVNNWSNYNIYYLGTKPEMPGAVLFDPKSDGKNLTVSSRWEKVTDEKTVQRMVNYIETQTKSEGSNRARLWKVLGPDDTMYGYVYTIMVKMVVTPIDQNTVRMEDAV